MFLQALKVVASEVMVGDTCIQTCNVAASEKIVGERWVSNLIVINSTINQLESKVLLITTRCLSLFVVVYNVEMLQHQR